MKTTEESPLTSVHRALVFGGGDQYFVEIEATVIRDGQVILSTTRCLGFATKEAADAYAEQVRK